MKTLAFTLSVLLVSAGTALGAQNVANTNQKGSLLIWPLIDISYDTDTLIEISNDANKKVHVNCNYVNEKKGRVDFHFELTKKQTASWVVGSRDGDRVNPPVFPHGGSFTGGAGFPPVSSYRGELVCFAVNADEDAQIAWNHLSGTATVFYAGKELSGQAYRYNAWSFVARNAAGLPETAGVKQGTPGRLDLTGNGAGTYDACPLYNIANFMPNYAKLGGLGTVSNVLTVVSCNQDLRQDYLLNLTKLKFTVWNSYEQGFTGAYICVDSVNSVHLGARTEALVNGYNFDYETVATPNARFQVSGVTSTQCAGSVASGLLGVLASDVEVVSHTALVEVNGFERVASATHGAGSTPGFVLWDPWTIPPARPN